MENRLLAMEGAVGNLTGQLNTFSGEIQRLLQVVADNDVGMKQAIETQIAAVQLQIQGADQVFKSSGTALGGRLTAASGALEVRLAAIEGMTAEMTAIKGAQSQLTRDQVNMSDGLKSKFAEIEAALLTKGPDQGPKREFEGKPLMEYKMIGDLGKLSNDKSGFRDWKEKTKDALSSIYRDEDLMKILEYIEDPMTKWTGLETLGESYDDAELNGISCEKGEWEK